MPLLDSYGRPVPDAAPRLADPIDGYEPRPRGPSPELREELARHVAGARQDGADEGWRGVNFDAFANELTGVGTIWGDKTRGGRANGPAFELYRLRNAEAEARMRGSDLGANIVAKLPDEMTREGWDVEVQPVEDERLGAEGEAGRLDAALSDPRRAALGWRRLARALPWRYDPDQAEAHARRWDDLAAGDLGDPSAPPPLPPGPLPRLNDEGLRLSRAVQEWGDAVDVVGAVNAALRYERAFGGGCVLIGVDDGVADLTRPLDPRRVRRVTHLTPFSGGWDGEVVAWRYYHDASRPNFGRPEIYQLRNIGVPLARPPAPGETGPVEQRIPGGPAGGSVWYVHESRLLVFDGAPASRQAQQEMRGWGDSVFTRVNDVLAAYDLSWNAVTILVQEFSIVTLAIQGLGQRMASGRPEDREAFLARARHLQLTQSIARTRLIDSSEKLERMNATLSGVPELLREMAARLAAAADMPLSLLFGQVAGALGGDAGATDVRWFYDRVRSAQNRRLVPALTRLYDLVWRSAEGPSRGRVPERWRVVPRPLWQSTPGELADLRLKTTQADAAEIQAGVVSAEEVAATRYGGAAYNPGPVVLDLDGRAALVARESATARAYSGAGPSLSRAPSQPAAPEAVPEPLPEPERAPAGRVAPPVVETPLYPEVPPLTATPRSPLTGDLQGVSTLAGNTRDPQAP